MYDTATVTPNLALARQRVRLAKRVYVGVPVTPDNVLYFDISKKSALWAIDNLASLDEKTIRMSTIGNDGGLYIN